MTQKTKAQLATDLAANLPNNTAGTITPAVMRTMLTDMIDSLAAVPTARDDWATAGGSAPSLGGVYPDDPDTPGVAVDLGTSPTITSKFTSIGKMCSASFRIRSGTTPASGEGYMTLEGLPVAPLYQGTVAGGGNFVGHGMMISLGNGRATRIAAVIDPAYSETKPIFFYYEQTDTAADDTSLNSAASTGAVTTDTPEQVDAVTVYSPVSFGPPTPIVHGGGTEYPTHGTMTPAPFDLAVGFIINCELWYEGV